MWYDEKRHLQQDDVLWQSLEGAIMRAIEKEVMNPDELLRDQFHQRVL
jgi:hypothetical protein